MSVSVPVFEREARVKYLSHSSVLTKWVYYFVSRSFILRMICLCWSDFLESDKMVFALRARTPRTFFGIVETFLLEELLLKRRDITDVRTEDSSLFFLVLVDTFSFSIKESEVQMNP